MRPNGIVISLLTCLLAPSFVAAGTVFEGRFLDGEASTRSFQDMRARGQEWQGHGDDWYAPLADQDVTVSRIGDAHADGKTWTIHTDAEGRFSHDMGEAPLPADARLVARGERDGRAVFSASFSPGGTDRDIFLYPISDSPRDMVCEVIVVHDVETKDGERFLRVQFRVYFYGRSGHLYVGRRDGSNYREILRIPLPDGAEVTRNSGPLAGSRWSPSDDGKWLVIDEPIPGLPDTLKQFARKGVAQEWTAEYLAPARQALTLAYSLPVACQGLSVYALHEDMKIVSRVLQQTRQSVSSDPTSREKGRFDLYEARDLEAATRVYLALEVSNVAVGQISRQALAWHGGFVLACLVGTLLAAVFMPRRTPDDVSVVGLGREEALDRIAALDRRKERGDVKERDYHRWRDALVEVAAEELQLTEGGGPSPETGLRSEGGSRLPPAAPPLLERLREIDRAGDTSPATIQERAHLLEALYKTFEEDTPA